MLKNPPVKLKILQITMGYRMKTTPKFCFTASLPSLSLSYSSLTHFNVSLSPHLTFLLRSSSFPYPSSHSLCLSHLHRSTNYGTLCAKRWSCQSLIITQAPHYNTLCAKCKMRRFNYKNMKRTSCSPYCLPLLFSSSLQKSKHEPSSWVCCV